MEYQDLDVLRTKWSQLAYAIHAILADHGASAGWNEPKRIDNRVNARTSASEINVVAPVADEATIDFAVRYMQRTAEGRDVLTGVGPATCRGVNALIDRCEAAVTATKAEDEQRLDIERLDDDGGRSAAQA